MLLDARTIASGTTLEADICIVGSGPAGISVAMKLAEAGLDVLLVESGGRNLDADQQKLARGSYAGAPYSDLEALRLRMLGGSSGHWAGQSLYLDPIDFEQRPWVDGSGWPIPYADYTAYLRPAIEICGLDDVMSKDDLEHGFAEDFETPLDKQGFRSIALFYSEDGPRRFGAHFHDTLEASETIRVLTHAPVQKLNSDDDMRHVSSADVKTLNNRTMSVRARQFVLAAGGIENSRLLLLSGPENGPGLGNARDQVGRYFMEHPNYFIGGFEIAETSATAPLRSPRSPTNRIDLQLTPDKQRELKILNHSLYLVPSDRAVPHHRELSWLSRIWRQGTQTFNFSTYSMLFRFEHAPMASSRITLGRRKDPFGSPEPHINFDFGDLETKTLDVVTRRFAEAIGAQQLGRGGVQRGEVNSWKSDPGWQVHHYGGTRMGTSTANSVVNTDCRVHGLDNLYVAGSSVFPTSGHCNPTVNLVALSLRLADHLANREGL